MLWFMLLMRRNDMYVIRDDKYHSLYLCEVRNQPNGTQSIWSTTEPKVARTFETFQEADEYLRKLQNPQNWTIQEVKGD